jgi:NAD(P)H dehydrogenase (quinone)
VRPAKSAGVADCLHGIALKDMETAAQASYGETLNRKSHQGKWVKYTVLRNTLYTGATPLFGGDRVIKAGINLPTGNGKVPFALRREMGEAAANTLLQNGHENQTYEITGSDLYSYGDVAYELSSLSGRTVN